MISGFKDLTIERMNVSFDFDSPEDFTTFTSETVGPLRKILASQTNKRKGEILKAVTEAARKYIDNKAGKVRFENEAILIVGKK
jgi:ribosomal protein L14